MRPDKISRVEAAEATPPTASLSGTRLPIQDGAIRATVTNLAAVSSSPGCGVSYAYSCGVSYAYSCSIIINNLTEMSTIYFQGG